MKTIADYLKEEMVKREYCSVDLFQNSDVFHAAYYAMNGNRQVDRKVILRRVRRALNYHQKNTTYPYFFNLGTVYSLWITADLYKTHFVANPYVDMQTSLHWKSHNP